MGRKTGEPAPAYRPVPQLHFMAGAAQVDITPPLGTLLGSDFVSHYARHIHDPLYAKALVFQQKDTKLAIIVVDICIMPSNYMDAIKQHIQEQTGILPTNVLLACNHNHASGDVVGLLGGAADINYKEKLPALIIESVVKANDALRPAKVAFGSAEVPDFVICRRYLMQEGYEARNPVTGQNDGVKTNPIGDEAQIIESVAKPDPELSFLLVKGLDDKWIGVLGNYGLHYVGDWPEDSVTGDYFGEFAARLKEKLGADDNFVAMMSNGTSGDVNLWSFQDSDRFPTEDYAKTQLVGGTLAQKVAKSLENLDWQEKPDLSSTYEELEIDHRKPSEEELAKATESFIAHDFKNIGYDPESVQRIYDREQVLLSQ
ncbi:neutral/alkaline non-lysosomal ceramidase N-terminal domain-containing protein, partial [Persicitalea sp.]|uniref:neutral/alkaline non-lysosomal ceramidase N-terminal domain-containing protein n=1 Tax=Persicitalea sp. TaxID=3100273 RepID=UPI00359418EB